MFCPCATAYSESVDYLRSRGVIAVAATIFIADANSVLWRPLGRYAGRPWEPSFLLESLDFVFGVESSTRAKDSREISVSEQGNSVRVSGR